MEVAPTIPNPEGHSRGGQLTSSTSTILLGGGGSKDLFLEAGLRRQIRFLPSSVRFFRIYERKAGQSERRRVKS